MGRLFGALAILLMAMMAPAVLVTGAIGMATGQGDAGSSSPFVQQLQALGYENGYLPDDVLAVVSTRPGHDCRLSTVGSANQAWVALVDAARLDGVVVEGGWCYRTYESQVAAWTRRRCHIPGNCDGDPFPPTARPGTSLHGWGLAIDVWDGTRSLLRCSSPELVWLHLFAPRFGWVNPEWAGCGQNGAEPWHWEYVGTDLEPVSGDGS
ncbi:MAG: M15 family metallopeptidase [Acidimicrobiia bacterium]